MKTKTASAVIASLLCLNAHAGMIMMDTATYNLSDAKTAGKCAHWSHSERLAVTERGLGWDGAANSSFDLQLLLQPIAIGHGWRPAGNAGIKVQLNFEDEENVKNYFTTYVRYSPNGENWSTWQALTQNLATKQKAKAPEKEGGEQKKGQPIPKFQFSGQISVPRREMAAYRKKQREFMKLDVPWSSDEHALCEWIVKEDPKFFEKNLPFPGFLQVYVEGSLHGGTRLKSVLVNHNTSTSGLHLAAKDPEAEKKREGVWAYWTVNKDDKKPACDFHEVFKSPESPR